jgi:hypothetical protein
MDLKRFDNFSHPGLTGRTAESVLEDLAYIHER